MASNSSDVTNVTLTDVSTKLSSTEGTTLLDWTTVSSTADSAIDNITSLAFKRAKGLSNLTSAAVEVVANTTARLYESSMRSEVFNTSNVHNATDFASDIDSTVDDVPFPSERLWASQNESPSSVVWRLQSTSELGVVLVVIGLASVLTLIIIMSLLACFRKRHTYEIIPSTGDNTSITYDYIYKPLIGSSLLDEEYENTFVGVSIPLLQQNTKV